MNKTRFNIFKQDYTVVTEDAEEAINSADKDDIVLVISGKGESATFVVEDENNWRKSE